MKITFIVPAYNEEKRLGLCLDSLIRNLKGEFAEIIVVDNASVDRTAIVAMQRQGVKVIHEAQRGLCFARERGRMAATGDLIAYIDADSRLPDGWVDIVEQEFRNHPETVCLSGPPTYFDASPVRRLLLRCLWWALAPLTYRFVGYMVFGAHFVVRKGALEKIGGFDRTIEFYGEDTDIARRLRRVGKVTFRMDFLILTSARRFDAEGILKTCIIYALNYLWPAIFRKPFSNFHRDIR